MSVIKYINFDLDDTVVKTNTCLVRNILTKMCHHKEKDEKRKEAYRHLFLNPHASLMGYKEKLIHLDPEVHQAMESIIVEYGLADDQYMLDVEIDKPLVHYIEHVLLKEKENIDLRINICTHRGISENASEHTERYLEANKVRHLFDEIHILHPKEWPDKRDFLKSVQGNDFVLLDDNPTYAKQPIPKCDKLIVCNTVFASQRYKHQTQFNSNDLSALHHKLTKLGFCKPERPHLYEF